ncbi:hypothetical protein [Dethiosulfovibrio salsuginis]|uniref:WD40-like Beta Propeller Repeat n=1 Tax=Dethiosulfovibrio salsuginis TaxID=561720 RepID=A0A1X7INQ7_9BACT|nr:hypothetical protein [Dethiosulfovibrio salsuginis]SMG16574.1 hypothetical protein SAMN06275492_1045 [Dethiosulfovibrio salsuginis]
MIKKLKKAESKLSAALNKNPKIKKGLKRLYQITSILLSPKKCKVNGSVKRVTPGDDFEYFFGYYDKSPWDATDRYLLSLKTVDTHRYPASDVQSEIVIVDSKDDKSTTIASTTSWNVQQGCMLQWLGPDFSSKIIFNTFRDKRPCSVILNVKSKEEEVIPAPIYSISQDGKTALTLDFYRLNRLRPGYGYINKPDVTAKKLIPDGFCIWSVDISTKKMKGIFTYKDLMNIDKRDEMIGAEHKVNHLSISPSGNRFMFIHRWINKGRKYSRLLTANIDGSDLFNLSDDDMISHCTWKDDNFILGYLRKNKVDGYFLLEDKTHNYKHLWPTLVWDGHPSYSPDRSMVITDTYPDRTRTSKVMVLEPTAGTYKEIASMYNPFKYDNDVRCDLHPRWNRRGDAICVDGVFEGKRAMYTIPVSLKKSEVK